VAEPMLAVTCMINNNREHTLQFVRYFTSIPGCQLILFLDDPAHSAYFEQQDIANLSLTLCSEQYWHEQLGRQPKDMPEKQHTNIRRGADIARELGCSWCLSVDSDELVSNLEELIPQLDSLGEGFDMLRLRPAELVHTETTAFATEPFQGWLFKYPWTDSQIYWMLPGLPIRLALRLLSMRKYTRQLFFGHPNGKTIFRLSAPITQYKQHRQFSKERALSLAELPRRYLILHYDAMDFDTWLFKWARRINGSTRATAISEGRKLQTEIIAKALRQDDPEAARNLFRKWLVFDDREVRALQKARYLFDVHDISRA
jgi:hypothetical protein